MEEVDKIKTSGRLNTDNLKAYLQFVLEKLAGDIPGAQSGHIASFDYM